jgi:hypothetical protein
MPERGAGLGNEFRAAALDEISGLGDNSSAPWRKSQASDSGTDSAFVSMSLNSGRDLARRAFC